MPIWAVGRVPIFEALKSIFNAAKMPIFGLQILKLCRAKILKFRKMLVSCSAISYTSSSFVRRELLLLLLGVGVFYWSPMSSE